MPSLSVIVSTSPGREPQLAHCLEQLSRQSHTDFEVIVCDDGSAACRAVAEGFAGRLTLDYLWRPNDGSPSRSRNAGARQARHPLLVLIDSDVLLNSDALAAYARFLDQRPGWLLYGYVGLEAEGPSALLPQVAVNWRDPRFSWDGAHLMPTDKLMNSSHLCGFGGNFAVHRDSLLAIGGFDEAFIGWGGEDLAFAEQALQAGYEIHFVLDAWGEHQIHPRREDFHLRRAEDRGYGYVFRPHLPVGYQVRVFASQGVLQKFETLLAHHYPR